MISMREAYEKIGADYDGASVRLMGEEMLARFALKFLDDESMDKFEAAIAAGDAEGAFMAVHTLKGVTAPVMGYMRCDSSMRLRCRPCVRWLNKSLRVLTTMRVDNLPF